MARFLNTGQIKTKQRLVAATGVPCHLVGHIIGTGIAFVNGDTGASTRDTITDSGTGFVTEKFVADEEITVSGTTNNDGDYEIYSVTAGTITLKSYGALVDEAAGSSFTITSKTGFPVPDGVTVCMKAMTGNTANIYVGGSSTEAVNTGSSYFLLRPGEAVEYQVSNLNAIWIDVTTNDDGVEITLES